MNTLTSGPADRELARRRCRRCCWPARWRAARSSSASRPPSTIYAPDPRVQADPAGRRSNWPLSLVHADRRRAGRQPAHRGAADARRNRRSTRARVWAEDAAASWCRNGAAPLEDSGKILAVARPGSGVRGDYQLVMDLRRFEADYAGAAVPSATIEVNAKLVHAPRPGRRRLAHVPAGGACGRHGCRIGGAGLRRRRWARSATTSPAGRWPAAMRMSAAARTTAVASAPSCMSAGWLSNQRSACADPPERQVDALGPTGFAVRGSACR